MFWNWFWLALSGALTLTFLISVIKQHGCLVIIAFALSAAWFLAELQLVFNIIH